MLDSEPVALGCDVGLVVAVAAALAVTESEPDGDGDGDHVGVSVEAAVVEPVAVGEAVLVAVVVSVTLADSEGLRLAVVEAVGVDEEDNVVLSVLEAVAVCDTVGDTGAVLLLVKVGLFVPERDLVQVAVCVREREPLDVRDALNVVLDDRELVRDLLAFRDQVGERVTDGDRVPGDVVGVVDGRIGRGVGVADGVGVGVFVGDAVADGDDSTYAAKVLCHSAAATIATSASA